jgi:hypothetical protein
VFRQNSTNATKARQSDTQSSKSLLPLAAPQPDAAVLRSVIKG